MSNELFPDLPGAKIEVSKAPRFSTGIQRAVSGKELRASFAAWPIWSISLSFEFLRDCPQFDELSVIEGFFLSRRGSFDSFLFPMPGDSQVTNQLIGVGDGVTTSFQLVRSRGSFSEPVANVENVFLGRRMWDHDPRRDMYPRRGSTPLMWSKGLSYDDTQYTLSSAGLVTLSTAPDVGVPVYWSGEYFYRCRFKEDELDFERFLHELWQLKRVELVGSLGTKI